MKGNKEEIKILAQKTTEKYVGEPNTKDILNKLRSELDVILNNYLANNEVTQEDFPIEFENDYTRWKILKDGKTYVYPKKGAGNITINFTIKKTGEIEYEK